MGTIVVNELAAQIRGTILTANDEGYEESLLRWASNAERKAAVVVLVSCPGDVAAAVIPPPTHTN